MIKQIHKIERLCIVAEAGFDKDELIKVIQDELHGTVEIIGVAERAAATAQNIVGASRMLYINADGLWGGGRLGGKEETALLITISFDVSNDFDIIAAAKKRAVREAKAKEKAKALAEREAKIRAIEEARARLEELVGPVEVVGNVESVEVAEPAPAEDGSEDIPGPDEIGSKPEKKAKK
jgi:hypothetical protein